MTPLALAEAVTRSDPTRSWRLAALISAGYTPPDALVLSGREEVDLHVAVDLLQRGCAPALAMRILL